VVAPHYNFQYGVSDAETGQQFSHGENRDNYNTAGEYRVNLPDGRIQIVTYKADEVREKMLWLIRWWKIIVDLSI